MAMLLEKSLNNLAEHSQKKRTEYTLVSDTIFTKRVIGDSKPITTSTRQAQTAGTSQPIGAVLRRARPEVVAMVTQGAACMADDAGVMDYSNGMGSVKGGWG
ncbi:hypothetical protein AOLI_G00291520 [Acnodon oligacanthus]